MKTSNKRVIRKILVSLLLAGNLWIAVLPSEAAKNQFVTRGKRTYYYNAKGQKVRGRKKIKGNYYYFSKKGIRYQKGWKTICGKKYYFSKKNGEAKIGWMKLSGKKYYFSRQGILQKNRWIGKYYLGKEGYVIKTKKKEEVNSPQKPPMKPEVQKPNVETGEIIPTTDTNGPVYIERLSDQIYEDLNRFRVDQGKKPLIKAVKTLKERSIIRACYNLQNFIDTGDYEVLATHGSFQIGLGTTAPPEALMVMEYNPSEGKSYLHATNLWLSSPVHRANLLEDNDYMAVALVYSIHNGGFVQVSVIVTFGTMQTDTYSVNGVVQGIFNGDVAPLYDYTIHREGRDAYISKEYVEEVLLEIPSGKWEMYMDCVQYK